MVECAADPIRLRWRDFHSWFPAEPEAYIGTVGTAALRSDGR
jgi:hypothetical protein